MLGPDADGRWNMPAGTADTQIEPITRDITPESANSLVKIDVQITGGFVAPYSWGLFLKRDIGGVVTTLSANNTGTNRQHMIGHGTSAYTGEAAHYLSTANFSFIDKPNTTSEVTYDLWASTNATHAGHFWINRQETDTDVDTYVSKRTCSFLHATEFASKA